MALRRDTYLFHRGRHDGRLSELGGSEVCGNLARPASRSTYIEVVGERLSLVLFLERWRCLCPDVGSLCCNQFGGVKVFSATFRDW